MLDAGTVLAQTPTEARACDGFRATVLDDWMSVRRFLPKWREFLNSGVRGRQIYNDPEYILAAVAPGNGVAPCVVVVWQGNVIRAVAPLVMRDARFQLRFSVFTLCSLSARKIEWLSGRLVHDGHAGAEEYLQHIFDKLASERRRWDLLWLEGVGGDEASARALLSWGRGKHGVCAAFPSSRTEPHYRLPMKRTFEEYLATLGSGTRKNLRRRVRRFMQMHACGEERVLTKVTDPSQVGAFLRDWELVFQETWQANTYGYSSKCSEFQFAKLQRLAELGQLRSYVLRCQGEPVAFQFGLQYDGVFYAADFGFARARSAISPGSVLMYLFLEDLYREGRPDVIDLGQGESGQKTVFRGVRTDMRPLYFAHARRWRCVIAMQRAIDVAEVLVRAAIEKLGFDRYVRRILKRKM